VPASHLAAPDDARTTTPDVVVADVPRTSTPPRRCGIAWIAAGIHAWLAAWTTAGIHRPEGGTA
jgi:hypothetical protein